MLALGSTNNCFSQTKGKDISEYFNNVAQKIKGAKKIAVVGAGAVGIELAGEIIDIYPEKEVFLIGKKLLSNPKGLTGAFRNQVKELIKTVGIKHLEVNAIVENMYPKSWSERILENTTLKFTDGSSSE